MLDLDVLYRTSLPRLRRIAAGIGLPATDAEDALHDSYVAFLQQHERFGSEQDADRWLIRVAVNRCLLHLRRQKRSAKALTGWRLTQPANPPAPAADLEAVRDALQRLDGDEVGPLVLRYFCDMNATAIAEILLIPASTVRGRLRAARMKLAEVLIAGEVVSDA